MAVCEKDHVGDMPDAALKALEDLPDSQRGSWRHRCPACAYLAGFRAGESSALALLADADFVPCPHKRVIMHDYAGRRACLDCNTWIDPMPPRKP